MEQQKITVVFYPGTSDSANADARQLVERSNHHSLLVLPRSALPSDLVVRDDQPVAQIGGIGGYALRSLYDFRGYFGPPPSE